MFEIKVRIEAPELSQAIITLGEALKGSLVLYPSGEEAELTEVHVEENPSQGASVIAESVPAAQTAVQAVNAIQPQAFMNPPEPVPSPAPVPAPTTSPVPSPVPAPKVDMDMIKRAGASLVDQGKMNDILALLSKYGVQAVNKLDPSQFPAFADDLRALGANI